MGFSGFLLVNAMRVNMSVALVDMVDSGEDDNSSTNENCPVRSSFNQSDGDQRGWLINSDLLKVTVHK